MRAVKRSVLRIKGTEGCIYEEAYFIIKDGDDASYKTENATRDMVFEANKIIEGCAGNRKGKKRADSKALLLLALCFTVGMIIGGGITLIAILPLL